MTAVTISTFKNKHDNNPLRQTLEWAELVKHLTTQAVRQNKDGPLFSPAIYVDGYTRRDEHVAAISLAVADFDNGANWETIKAGLNKRGMEWLAYSTFSSTPQHPRWRVVVPLSKPVPVNLWRDMAERIHGDLFPEAEPHFDPSRMYYLPSCPPDSLPFTFHNTGRWLDPSMLPEVPKTQRQAAANNPRVYSPYLQAAISRELEKLRAAREPNRNIQLNKSAFALAQFVPSGQIDRSCLEALLEEVALEIGLDTKEIKATLKSGIEAGMKEPREVPEPATRTAKEAPNLTSAPKKEPVGSEVLQPARLVKVSAATLQEAALDPNRPPLEFLPLLGRERFFVKGFSHLLSAYPKTGKTTLLAQQALTWGQDGITLLYFTEEPRIAWEERLKRLPKGGETVSLVFALGRTLNEIMQMLEESDEEVIVIDSTKLLLLQDENDNGLINTTLTPLIALCRNQGKTLVLIHHTRKMGGEHGVAASGGHALAGIVDAVLELQRESQAPKRRRIRGWGRVIEVPELLCELQDGVLAPLGDPQDVALQDLEARLREQLNGEWRKTEELRENLGEPKPSSDQALKALQAMATAGEIERDPPIAEGSKRGKTYRWRANLTSDDLLLNSGS